MNYSIFKSRTFWSIVATFLVVGGNSVVPLLPAGWQDAVVGILSIAAVYFHVNPQQSYNPPPQV